MVELKNKNLFTPILIKGVLFSLLNCQSFNCFGKESEAPPKPVFHPNFFKIILPAKSAVLSEGKKELNLWKEREEYRKNWNINPLGKYDTPRRGHKKRYVQDLYLKHLNKEVQKLIYKNKSYTRFEKSLKGEKKLIGKKSRSSNVIRSSKRKSSKPKKQSLIQKKKEKEFEFYLTLKHKLNLFKGDGHLKIQSPFLDHETNLNQYRELTHQFKKDFNLFSLHGSFNYEWEKRVWNLQFQGAVFSKNIEARLKSTQSDKSMVFSNSSVVEGGLFFNKGF